MKDKTGLVEGGGGGQFDWHVWLGQIFLKTVFCCINHGIKVLNWLFLEMNRMLLFVYSTGDVATDWDSKFAPAGTLVPYRGNEAG